MAGGQDHRSLIAGEMGSLVVVLGSWRNTWAREINADGVVMMIATPLEDGDYGVRVWHQLHIDTLDTLRAFLSPS